MIAVIPARYASTRFPAKPLAKDTGKYLVQHVHESVRSSSKIDRVVVATDDDRIMQAVRSFGGEACMTRTDHATGTSRVAEVAAALGLADADVVLNVQGDEPEVDSDVLDRLIDRIGEPDGSCGIATLAAPFDDKGPTAGPGSPLDPNCVKVVVNHAGLAMYFSRSPIPYLRVTGGTVDRPSRYLLHLGVYAFRAGTLRRLGTDNQKKASALEEAESLEQLRWLEQGHAIAVEIVATRFVGIDTPEDYAAFVKRMASPAASVDAKR